jgi:plastocyanin
MSAAVPRLDRTRSLKLAAALGGVIALAAGCAPAGNPANIPVDVANTVVTQVVATGFDAGREPSVAIGPDGTPAVSFLLLNPTLAKGQQAPAPVPNTPQPPAVIVATYSAQDGLWTRTSASPQDYQKAKGTESSIADKDGKFLPGVNTGIAVDGQGKDHVVWATPTGLFYTDNTASAAFADPEAVTKVAATGASIAVDKNGTPWVAYYDGSAVTVATRANGTWVSEVLAQAPPCAGCPPVRTAIQLAAGNAPVVAYESGGSAIVQVAGSGAVPVGPPVTVGQGGFGVSLAINKDGIGYVASYGQDGGVNLAASSGPAASGGSWASNPLTPAPTASTGAEPVGWTTGIGVDDSGKVYTTWVDPVANDVKIVIAELGTQTRGLSVPQSLGGRTPALAVSPDGTSFALPFYDAEDHQAAVAVPAVGGVALGVPSPSASPPPTPPSGPACAPKGDATDLQIAAPTGASASGFSTNCLAVVPATGFTVAFDNEDAGVPHNWELFKDPAYSTRAGGAASASDIITGPNQASYDVDPLGAGTYYFRCDVHPTTMTGQLLVAKAGQGPQPGPSASPSG